ncbi:MAG: MBL fold metallo-hydrolase [Clostridiales bacterium]|nr:MBL fold metallo-hydrolase [Clostridiales bacterium]
MYHIINVGAVRGGEAFLLMNDAGAALVDTGFAFCADEMINNVEKHLNGRKLDSIFLTHSHYDHASGVPYCREKWPELKVYAAAYAKRVFERAGALKTIREMNDNAAEVFDHHEYRRLDEGLSVDVPLLDGDIVTVGSMKFKTIETPGHTMDCISFWCEDEKLLLSAETIGYPLLPEKVVPTFLVGYEMTIDSIRKLRALGAEKQLVSHLGVVDKPFIEEFLEKSEIWMAKTRDMILKAHAEGYDNEAIMTILKNEFYKGDIITLQPEKAFDLNCYYTVNMIIRECAPKAQD